MKNTFSTYNKCTYLELIWICVSSVVIFTMIRRLTPWFGSSKIFFNVCCHSVLFVFLVLAYIYYSSKILGFTFKECRVFPFQCTKGSLRMAVGVPLFICFITMIAAGGVTTSEIDPEEFIYITLLNFFNSSIASGITEELFFRGYLFRRVETKSNWKIAVLFTSICFGAGHISGKTISLYTISIFIGSVCLGGLLAVMTYKSGTIWGAVLLHMFLNLKERLVGFDDSSSLFVFKFAKEPVAFQIMMGWLITAAISLIMVWIYLGKKKS